MTKQADAPSPTATKKAGRPPTHGNTTLKNALKQDGSEAVSGDAATWKQTVRDELGGTLTPRQESVLEAASQARVQLERLDKWLGERPSLASYRKGETIPALITRDRLAQRLEDTLSKIPSLGVQAEPIAAILASIREKPQRHKKRDLRATDPQTSPALLPEAPNPGIYVSDDGSEGVKAPPRSYQELPKPELVPIEPPKPVWRHDPAKFNEFGHPCGSCCLCGITLSGAFTMVGGKSYCLPCDPD